jgi:mRNA-degrading endonuclease RelE of RelBE toxin-antitoxin system
MNLKRIIKEELDKLISEDYSVTFNMEDFKKLTSFNKRIAYCKDKLKRISSGSSRIVYQIDDTKVLKLARNQKGLAQNENEISASNDSYINYIFAQVFESDDKNLWLEMELCKKLTESNFKEITGFSWNDYNYIMVKHNNNINQRKYPSHFNKISDEMEQDMWNEDGVIYDMLSYIGSYDVPVGDLLKLNSYGVVNRDGVNTIVLLDFGLTNNTFNDFYN